MNNNIQFIDGLKGIMCVTVFLFHFYSTFNFIIGVQSFDNIFSYPNPLNIFIDGVWAVRVFLILSAFIFSYSISQGANTQRIILKRYFRLMLPIAFATLFAFILQPLYLVENVSSITGQTWINQFSANYSLIRLVKNVFLTVPCGFNDYVGVAWMIKYLFWGTFLVIILRISIEKISILKQNIILICFTILCYGVSDMYACIVFGVILHLNQDFFKQKCKYKLVILIMMLVASLIIHSLNRFAIGNFFSSILFVTIVFSSSKLQNVLSKNIFLKLSSISFWIYLLHCPILFSLSSYLFLKGFSNISLLITIIVVYIVSVFAQKIISPIACNLTKKIVFKLIS